MKWLVASLVGGMCCSYFSAEDYRIFTDKKDRSVEARIINFNSRSGKVTLERRNLRTFTVMASIFSADDQAHIKEWSSVRDFLSNSKLRIRG